MKDGHAHGVALKDGTEFHAKRVISGADANVTFLKLMDPKDLPADFLAAVKRIDYSSATVKINVALDRAAATSRRCRATGVGPQHHGTMHICPDQDYIERAYDDAKYGRWAHEPDARMHDGDRARRHARPAGQAHPEHVRAVRPVPPEGHDWDVEKDKFADRCFDILNEYAPNFKSSVLHRMVIPPPDMERHVGHHGREHHAGLDEPAQHVQLPPGRRATRTTARR